MGTPDLLKPYMRDLVIEDANVSSRSLQQRLQNILEQAKEILAFAYGLDYKAFCEDAQTVKAVLYDLRVIGEAARSLLPDIQDVYLGVPWEEM